MFSPVAYRPPRQATDLTPDFAQDARVLNRLFRPHPQRHVYQDKQNERVRAAEARRRMRAFLAEEQKAA